MLDSLHYGRRSSLGRRSIRGLLWTMAWTVVACSDASQPPAAQPTADPSVGVEAAAKASRTRARVDREILEDRIRKLRARTGVPSALEAFWGPCLEGRMNACESIGDAYRLGQSVERDLEATKLFYGFTRHLAEGYCDEGGDRIHGCSQLGRMYYEGLGVERNQQRGVALLRRGCSGGDTLACLYLENEEIDATGQ